MSRALIQIVCAGFAMAACSQGPEPGFTGRASVVDGDTIEIRGERIRLWGVDAPEASQTCERGGAAYRCGSSAANALDRWLSGRLVTCIEQDRDRYDRIVARCSVSGEDVGSWLVSQGHALRYTRYSGMAYAKEEASAQAADRGLWAGDFQAPWDWRRERRR